MSDTEGERIDQLVDDHFGNASDSDSGSSYSYDSDSDDDPIIGIDLGTTHSCVAIWRRKNLEIIPDENGRHTIPSMVSFTSRSIYIGKEAERQTRINPEYTYYDAKRLIGRKFSDTTVQNDLEFLTYRVEPDEEDNIRLKCGLTRRKQFYSPEEISSYVLIRLKAQAESYLGKTVKKAVITVPAYFNDAQREATKDAAEIAGLDCVRIINEPTAAALAYGLEKQIGEDDEMNVVVYDFGGGTLDVSLLCISDGTFEVRASTGNTHLGGEDFDHRLMSYCINSFKQRYRIKKFSNLSLMSLQKLKQSCENAKKVLSTTNSCSIVVANFYDGKSLFVKMTRNKFEYLCRDLLILCLKPLEDVLKSVRMDRSEIDEVILVGGSTRIPRIRNNITTFFNGLEPNNNVNADEVVAAGAAIQGYILGHKNDPFADYVVLLDIVPLSLGVETIGGVMNVLIPRNSAIPITRTKKYTTYEDNVKEIDIGVFEGERTMTRDNFKVGQFTLKGIEEGPRGYPQIRVTFGIDINGITTVKAKDLRNDDNENQIIVNSNKGRLKKEKIKQLVEEAKMFAIRDKIEREKKQLFYEIDDLCTNISDNIESKECKIKEKDKEKIQLELDLLQEWMDDKPYIEREIKELDKIVRKIKKKYGTLILRSIGDDGADVKKNADGKGVGTTVYGDEEDEESMFEKLEDEEFGFTDDMDQSEKDDIRQVRDQLISLCYSVVDVINCDSIKIVDHHKDELREYIDDILLWTHVKEKIKKSEYLRKIKELDESCNKVMNEYQEKEVFSKDEISDRIHSVKDELQQMCFAIQSCICSNYFSLDEENIKQLSDFTDDTLKWMLDLDIDVKRAELEGKEMPVTEQQYRDRLDQLNSLCNEMYEQMQDIHINRQGSVFADDSCIQLGPNPDHSHSQKQPVMGESGGTNETNETNEIKNQQMIDALETHIQQKDQDDISSKHGTSLQQLRNKARNVLGAKSILDQVDNEIDKEKNEKQEKSDPGGTSLATLKRLAKQRQEELKQEQKQKQKQKQNENSG